MSFRTVALRRFIQRNTFIKFASIAERSNNHKRRETNSENNNGHYRNVATAALFSSVLIGSTITDEKDRKSTLKQDTQQEPENVTEAGVKRPDLPTYRAEDVSKHDTTASFWVTYKHGVYDVTSFLPSHPGGEQILNSAGLSIEPFWNVYGMHKTPEVYTLLESYRIGNLHDEDVVDHTDDELWVNEPLRDKRLDVKTARPFNAEIPPRLQIQHFDTPNELFYVRQHMPAPDLDPSEHRLKVTVRGGANDKVVEFTLAELERFPSVTVRAALMCAGNRRSEMNKVKPVKGISWTTGAVSSAVWGGVRLRDVLLHCGVDPDDVDGKHVILQGADVDATGVNFSTSIPLRMALEPGARVVLATRMNAAPLPRDHGRPLRALVPGAPAVRSVKWLESITVSEDESPSHWHQKDYRAFNPSKTWETADFATAPPLYSLPVTSAICDPQHGDEVLVRDGAIQLRGYAYSGGGAKIVRVDVSADAGRSWVEAAPVCADAAPAPQHYAWTLWEARVPVAPAQRQVELWVKATDSNFNTQPERFDDIWNIRGLLSNAYHKITIHLKH